MEERRGGRGGRTDKGEETDRAGGTSLCPESDTERQVQKMKRGQKIRETGIH